VLNVDMGNSVHTAKWMIDNGKESAPVITYAGKSGKIATATVSSVTDNQIKLNIKPNTAGTDTVKLTFAGKTVNIKVSVGQVITKDMFNVDFEGSGIENGAAEYTGKAIKPKVTKTESAPNDLKFKTAYVNNVNAGTASVKITGSGKYAGELEYNFTIKNISITADNVSVTAKLKAVAYNGGENAPSLKVQYINGKTKKSLKAGTDYIILYNGIDYTGKTLPAGTYAVSIKGNNNYTGTISTGLSYEVTQTVINKVSVTCTSNVKYTGKEVSPITAVKIGKNILPESDYKIVYHQNNENGEVVSKLIAKGKYVAVITPKGNNITTDQKNIKIVKAFTVK
jgi:hypothetical protein